MIRHNVRTLKLITKYGLGNRLLAIGSALRLRRIGVFDEIQLCWKTTKDLDASFNELFDDDSRLVLTKDDSPIGIFVNYDTVPRDTIIPTKEIITVQGHLPFSNEGIDQSNLLRLIGPELQSLNFRKHYHHQADKWPVAGCLGLHCRRTDFPFSKPISESALLRYHAFLDESFAKTVETLNDQLFLASDSIETNRYFQAKFGTRLTIASKEAYPIWSNRSKAAIDGAIVDLLLLSRCRSILVDSHSTFSTVAGLIGGIERTVWERPSM